MPQPRPDNYFPSELCLKKCMTSEHFYTDQKFPLNHIYVYIHALTAIHRRLLQENFRPGNCGGKFITL